MTGKAGEFKEKRFHVILTTAETITPNLIIMV